MRFGSSRRWLLGALILSAVVGCDGESAFGPEEPPFAVRFTGVVEAVWGRDGEVPPSGVSVGDAATVTVSYTPDEDKIVQSEPYPWHHAFSPESDAQVTVTVGDYVWQMFPKRMLVHDDQDHSEWGDVVHITFFSGETVDSVHGFLGVSDRVPPFELVYGNSLPARDGDVNQSAITSGMAQVGVGEVGASWRIRLEIKPEAAPRLQGRPN